MLSPSNLYQETQRNENRKTENSHICFSSLLEAGHLWRAQMGKARRDKQFLQMVDVYNVWVVVSNIFYFHPYVPGEMIQFEDHIFQIGGNHLDVDL